MYSYFVILVKDQVNFGLRAVPVDEFIEETCFLCMLK